MAEPTTGWFDEDDYLCTLPADTESYSLEAVIESAPLYAVHSSQAGVKVFRESLTLLPETCVALVSNELNEVKARWTVQAVCEGEDEVDVLAAQLEEELAITPSQDGNGGA